MSDYLKRLAEALKKREAPMGPDAWDWQQFVDTSPAGSVNAPGGVSQPQERDKPQRLGKLLAGASMLPGPSGDLLGPISDAYMYATEPESRTPGNFALSALGALPFVPSLATAFHASPFKFDTFDMEKVGKGEGMQAYGHGIYAAESPAVSGKGGAYYEEFKKHPAVSETGGPFAYTLEIPDDAVAKMLDWEKPLDKQAPEIKAAFDAMKEDAKSRWGSFSPSEIEAELAHMGKEKAGWDLYNWASLKTGSESAASKYLRALGIPGIRYPAGEYRGGGQGLSNYVIFDDKLPKILKRE